MSSSPKELVAILIISDSCADPENFLRGHGVSNIYHLKIHDIENRGGVRTQASRLDPRLICCLYEYDKNHAENRLASVALNYHF